MLKKLENPTTNMFAIIIAEIITCSITLSLNYDTTSWSTIFLKWTPAIIGLGCLFSYFFSRLFFKKYNWIITILGILIMIIATVRIYAR